MAWLDANSPSYRVAAGFLAAVAGIEVAVAALLAIPSIRWKLIAGILLAGVVAVTWLLGDKD